MDSEQFSAARDLIYLAAMLLGAGIGCMLNRFKSGATVRFKNITVTAGFCFFSCALAALTAAIIFSNWMIYRETALYLPVVFFITVVILAFRFPRTAGFSLIIISGLFIVLLGFSFLRFPVINESGIIRINRELNGLINILPVSQNQTVSNRSMRTGVTVDSGSVVSFFPPEDETVLELRAFCISLSKTVPLVGGTTRGALTVIRTNDEFLYEDSRFERFFSLTRGFFIRDSSIQDNSARDKVREEALRHFVSFWEATARLETMKFYPGTNLIVSLDGSDLVFLKAVY